MVKQETLSPRINNHVDYASFSAWHDFPHAR